MKRVTKYISLFLLFIVFLFVSMVVFVQTPYFRNYLRVTIVEAVQPQIDGELTVGSLEGNLFSTLSLSDIRIRRADTTVIDVERLFVGYYLPGLISKDIIVKQVILSEPEIFLVKRQEGWNLTSLISSGQAEELATGPEEKSAFPWHIRVHSLQIDSGRVDIRAPSDGFRFPETIRDIQLDVGFEYAKHLLRFSLEKLEFETVNPGLKLKEMESLVRVSGDELDTTRVQFKTAASDFRIRMEIDNLDQPRIDAHLEAEALSLDEIGKFFRDFPLQGKINLSAGIEGPLSDLQLKLDLSHPGGSATLSGQIGIAEEPYDYRLSADFSDIDIERLTGNAEMHSSFDLSLQLDGTGMVWGQMNSRLSAVIRPGSFRQRRTPEITLNARAAADSLDFEADLEYFDARAGIDGYLITSGERPRYRIGADASRLNLMHILADSGLSSDLNMNLRLEGRGMNPDSFEGIIRLDLDSSRIRNLSIDTARIRLRAAERHIRIDDFLLKSPLLRMTAGGNFGPEKKGTISFSAEFTDLNEVKTILPIDSLEGSGRVTGTISGRPDSLQVTSDLDFQRLMLPAAQIGELQGRITGRMSDGIDSARIDTELRYAELAGFDSLDSDLSLTYRTERVDFDIRLQRTEDLDVRLTGKLQMPGDGYNLRLDRIRVDIVDQTWEHAGWSAEIIYRDPDIRVRGFRLSSEGQSVDISGQIGLSEGSPNDLTLKIDSMQIANILESAGSAAPLTGRLNLTVRLTGTQAEPRIEGGLHIAGGRYNERSFRRFSGDFSYGDERIDTRFLLLKTREDSLLQLYASLPFQLSFTPFVSKLLRDREMDVSLYTPGADVAIVNEFVSGIEDLEGNLTADIQLNNTMNDLRGTGPIRLQNGRASLPDLGVSYENIRADLSLDEKEVRIDAFRLESGDGNLTLDEGSLSLSRQTLDTFRVHLEADDFEAMNTDDLQMIVDGDLSASGSVQNISISGDLEVVEAEIHYASLTGGESGVELTSRPFFVLREDTTEFDSAGAIRFQESYEEAGTPFTETEFYKNIEGTVSLTINRNVWLRSEQANVELEGSLELQKAGTDFTLFGTVTTVRGYYEFQGRRFQIEEGEITFRGNPELNPDLQIRALYEYTDRSGEQIEEREMGITISGTLQTPRFDFSIDGQPADQKDVFAILLFGKPFDRLTVSEGSTVSNQVTLRDQAQGFLTGQLMDLLSRRFVDDLNLDVLQIESGESLGDTKVRVGKYVTDNVFISVSQDFGSEGEQRIKLEYKFPPEIVYFNLFLQALKEREGDTGMDLIWKYEW